MLIISTLSALLLFFVGDAQAQSLQSQRDRTAGYVATGRAKADFEAARRNQAEGRYGQAARDRLAGHVARNRADRDVLAADRDQAAADRLRILGR